MSLIRWNPSHDRDVWPSEPTGFQRELNRVFDTVFGPRWNDERTAAMVWSPAVDISEHDKEYLVSAELPGVEKKDVSVSVESNILTIRGTKKQEKETGKREYHCIERTYGSFSRSFTLPKSIDADTIHASFAEGILSIRLPKAEISKPKQITVNER